MKIIIINKVCLFVINQSNYHTFFSTLIASLIHYSIDEFSVATPDETAGKDTEFSLVGCFRNE